MTDENGVDWVRLTETPYVTLNLIKGHHIHRDVTFEELDKYANSGVTQAEQATHWIEVAAYYIWLEEGCPHGRDLEHWEKAYQMFLERPDNQ